MRKRGLAALLAGLMVLAMSVPVLAQQRPFPDVPPDHWAAESVELLRAAGLIVGYPDGEFKGNRELTRYEYAMIVARLSDRLNSMIADQVDASFAEVEASAINRVNQAIADLRARLEAGEAADQALFGVPPAQVAASVQSTGKIPLSDPAQAAFTELAVQAIEQYLASYSGGEVEDALAGLNSRMTRLEARTLITQQDVRETRALIQETADTLQQSVQALLDEFRADLDAMGVRVADLESWRAETDQRIDALETRVDQLEREAVNLKNRIDMTQESADEATNRVMDLEREVTGVQRAAEAAQQTADSARASADAARLLTSQAQRTADEAIARVEGLERDVRALPTKTFKGAYQLAYVGGDETAFQGEAELFLDEVGGSDAAASFKLGMLAGAEVDTYLSLGVGGPVGGIETGAAVAIYTGRDTNALVNSATHTRFDLDAAVDAGMLRFTTGARFGSGDVTATAAAPGWTDLGFDGLAYKVGIGLPMELAGFAVTPVVDAVIADSDGVDGAETGIGVGVEVGASILGGELTGRLIYPASEPGALAVADKAATSATLTVPLGAVQLVGGFSTELGVDNGTTAYSVGIRGEF